MIYIVAAIVHIEDASFCTPAVISREAATIACVVSATAHIDLTETRIVTVTA